ncbi:MAG: MFS transporter [Syntrophobacteraceae bacterium]|jgi:ACS family glucarate transporter-like MFS transporter
MANQSVSSGNTQTISKLETGSRWYIVALLALGTAINYIDRVNFGVATPTLMKEFGLGTAEMGILMSAFFWSYTIAMLPSGYLLNKFGPKKVLGFAGIAWGCVTMLVAVCVGFYSFLALRIGIGVTEAPAFPANARVVSVWVPKRERTFASSMFDCAARAGGAFAPPIVAFIIAEWGWRMSFVVTGAMAVVWAIWWLLSYHEPADHPRISKSELAYIRQDEVITDAGAVHVEPISMSRLATYPVILKACLAYAFYLYIWTVFLYWIPTYLMKARGLSLKEMGVAASIPYIFAIFMELTGGKVFDKWYAKGASITKLRRTGMGIGMFGAAFFILMCMQANTAFWAIFWLSAFCGIFAFGASNVWAIPSDIAPYGQAGGVGGVYNFVGNFGALLAPMVTGYLAASKYGFNGAFAVCVAFAILGGLLFIFNSYDRLKPKAA